MDKSSNISKEIKVNEIKYPIKDLIDNCEALTSYKKEVAVGALFNCKKDCMSKNEFKEIIEIFLKTKIIKAGE